MIDQIRSSPLPSPAPQSDNKWLRRPSLFLCIVVVIGTFASIAYLIPALAQDRFLLGSVGVELSPLSRTVLGLSPVVHALVISGLAFLLVWKEIRIRNPRVTLLANVIGGLLLASWLALCSAGRSQFWVEVLRNV